MRGHYNLRGVRLWIDIHPHISSCLLFSHAIPDIFLFLETHNTKAQTSHPSLPGVTSTRLLLSCSEEARIGSCSRRSWGRKVRLEQASQQLEGLEESGACPSWSAPHFPPVVIPLPSPCPTAAKDHRSGKKQIPEGSLPRVLAQRPGRQPPRHLCPWGSFHPNRALAATAQHTLLLLSATGIHSYSLLRARKLCLVLIHGNEVVCNAKHCPLSYKTEVLKKIPTDFIQYKIYCIHIFVHI